ncbi:MAG: aromatic ring-hydroxylating dioxygenase subunit alpha [Rubrivivax sp.]|jgi:phenylpropionate dioxygenase-like ring-hydroxylating dioxygenase large terminal subunit|nr:aromatic ring-hydroxylating dioxygenase subunit alpha [Rubrivivax sp.]
MSDLSISLRALEQGRSQLPVSHYFDEALFREEQRLIFEQAPRYLGHALALPQVGDFHALPQESEGRALVRRHEGPDGIELIGNVCRHRQALMLRGRGNTQQHVVCPLHRWTYDLSGKLVGAPHFAQDPCLNLRNHPVQSWNGLLFEAHGQRRIGAELADLSVTADLDFTGYQLDRIELHECNYNWKTFIEVYLEDYHVGPFHPGLGNFVTCDDLRWEFGRHHSVQTVGARSLQRAGTPTYRRWQDAVRAFRNGEPPAQGAIWLTLYPTVMVEWYPHVLVVSSLHPMGVQRTLNVVEFYYPEEIVAFEREFVEAQQAAYMETCIEDDEIAERMDAGRRVLMERGEDDAGPYQSPMEDGMQHFHEWYRGMMGDAVGPAPRSA